MNDRVAQAVARHQRVGHHVEGRRFDRLAHVQAEGVVSGQGGGGAPQADHCVKRDPLQRVVDQARNPCCSQQFGFLGRRRAGPPRRWP